MTSQEVNSLHTRQLLLDTEKKKNSPKGSDHWQLCGKKSEISVQLYILGVFKLCWSNFFCYYEPVFFVYTPVSLQLNYLLYASGHCGNLLISHQCPRAELRLCSYCWFSGSGSTGCSAWPAGWPLGSIWPCGLSQPPPSPSSLVSPSSTGFWINSLSF